MKKKILAMILALSTLFASFGIMTAQAEVADKYVYTVNSIGMPLLNATYTKGSETHFYESSDIDKESALGNLNDGDYTTGVLIAYTKPSETQKTEGHYIEIEFDKEYVINGVLFGVDQTYYLKGMKLGRYEIDYYDSATESWVEGSKWSQPPTKYDDDTASVKNKRSFICTRAAEDLPSLGNFKTKKIRIYATNHNNAASNAAYYSIDELVVFGSEDYTDTYAWNTATANISGPIRAEYSLGSNLEFYDSTEAYSLENLYDGDYRTKTLYNYTRNTSVSGVVPKAEEGCYIELQLGDWYKLDQILVGINTDSHDKNRMARCLLTYRDVETGEWQKGNFDVSWGIDINWKYKDDGAVLKKKSVMIDSSYTGTNLTFGETVTDAIRVYPTCIATGGTRLEIDELVAFGKKVPHYDWNTPDKESSYTTSGYLNATYSVPDTFRWSGTALTNEQLTANLTDCNVGGTEAATKANGVGAVVSGSGKNEWIEEENYIEMDLGRYCTVDSIYYAVKNIHVTNGWYIGRYNVKYYDEHSGEWKTAGYRLYTNSGGFTADEDGTYKYIKLSVGKAFTAKKLRLEFFRALEFYNKNLIALGELIPMGIIASDVADAAFTYKNAEGEQLSDFSSDAATVIPEISVIRPAEGKYTGAKFIAAFYGENGLLDVKMTDMESDCTASFAEGLAVPEGTAQMKVFLWKTDILNSLTEAFTVKKN